MSAEPTTIAPAEAPEYIDDQDPGVTSRGPWQIDSLGAADWALSRIADLEREIEENETVAAEAIARIEARTKALNDKAMRGVAFFRAKLAAFAEAQKKALLGGGKKKSRELHHGRIGWRSSAAKLQVVDDKALLEWARAQPIELGLVRIKEAPDLNAIKAHAKLKQVIPPGMQEVPEDECFYAEVNAVSLSLVKKGGA